MRSILILWLFLGQIFMTISPSLPSYSDLTKALDSAESPFLAAQIHGYVCGLLCGSSGKMDNSWQNNFLKDKKDRTARDILQQLSETSFHLISEFSFEFTLVLPDDKYDINVRTEALGSWCQGFLSGLTQCDVPLENREPGEMTDALTDILEITKVSFGDMEANEEDEMAYFELVEYVRLAVLMIFQELINPTTTDGDSEEDTWQH